MSDSKKSPEEGKKVSWILCQVSWFFLLVVLITFTLTGALLIHRADLGLDKKRITSEWLMARYGLTFDQTPHAWNAEGIVVTQWGEQCLLHEISVNVEGVVISVVGLRSGTCIATSEGLYYFGLDQKLIEKLEPSLSLPSGEIKRLGVIMGRLIVKSSRGAIYFRDDKLLEYEEFNGSLESVQWSQSETLNESAKNRAKAAIIGEGVSLDRVILDIYAGNICPWVGRFFADVSVIALFVLSLCGARRCFRKKPNNYA